MPEISTGLSSTNHEVDTISKQSLSTSALISSPWYLGGHEMLKHSFLHFLVRYTTQKVVGKFPQRGSIWIYFEGDSSHEFTLQ